MHAYIHMYKYIRMIHTCIHTYIKPLEIATIN